MLTLKSVNKLFEDIVRDNDLDEAILDKVKRLKKDFEERDSYLSKVGKTVNEDDVEDYEYMLNERGEDWETRYIDLRERYIRRFFDGDSKSEIEKNEIEDIEKKLEDDEEENELSVEDLY